MHRGNLSRAPNETAVPFVLKVMTSGGLVTDWEDALVRLMRARDAALTRYAFLLTGDRHEAEELLQDTLVRLVTGRTRPMELERLEAYVRTSMANRVVDQARRRRLWWRAMRTAPPPTAVASHEEAVTGRSEVVAALRSLSPRQRTCLVLRYYEDQSVRSIAEQLGVSEGSVKRHLADATKRLAALQNLRTSGAADESP